MPRISVSTWSLHRALGPRYETVDGERVAKGAAGEINLLEVPRLIAARGIGTLEMCHFHLPSLDESYIKELRAALDEAGVELFSILIDAGDITHPDAAARAAELDWIRSWLEVAGRCGAGQARVIAGYAELEANGGDLRGEPLIRLSAENLRSLARFGREQGVRVITENFRALTRRPEAVLAILDLCEGEVGLCVDFGNFKGETKYRDLAAILPRADSIHAKADFSEAGVMVRDDFVQCLDLAQGAGFEGPYSLIFEGAGRELEGLATMREVVLPYTTAVG